MRRIRLYICVLAFVGILSACDNSKRDSEQWLREGLALVNKGDSITRDECVEAQSLFARAIEHDAGNMDVYFHKTLCDLLLWEPESAYRTAGEALKQIGNGDHYLKPYFLTVRGMIDYDRKEMNLSRKSLEEALKIYEQRISRNPVNLDNILNKSILLISLGRKEDAEDFINNLPQKQEEKDMLSRMAREYDPDDFGISWREKNAALK